MMAVILRRIHPLIQDAADSDPDNIRLADFPSSMPAVLWFQEMFAPGRPGHGEGDARKVPPRLGPTV